MPALDGKKMFLYLAPKKVGVQKKSQQKRDREAEQDAARQAAKVEQEAAAEANGLLANAKGGEALKKLAETAEE